jgi:hypothetical protein
MEGPSLVLAKEQLRPFKGKTVLALLGNTTIGKERLIGHTVLARVRQKLPVHGVRNTSFMVWFLWRGQQKG